MTITTDQLKNYISTIVDVLKDIDKELPAQAGKIDEEAVKVLAAIGNDDFLLALVALALSKV